MPVGFFISGRCWQQSSASARDQNKSSNKRCALPISALLARIRKLIPCGHDDHYDEIVRGFGNGALRLPSRPMSDRELSSVIADFLKDAPSVESIGTLGRRLDPSSPL
jgi:hypothetical protein